MSSFASIRQFITTLTHTTPTLHIALLNAGIAAPKYELTIDGWESALQVNVIGTAFLALLLLPILRKTAQETGFASQLTFTSSSGHMMVSPSSFTFPISTSILKELNTPEAFSLSKSYMNLKLLGMYMMLGLSHDYTTNPKTENEEIYFTAVCPGYCYTDMGREMPWYMNSITAVVRAVFGRSAEVGARCLVSGSLLGREGNGRFWSNDWFTE
jgi:NAD(P)-dependent dehydrogenase (short-subunit alcohol dehydrogenase family)